MSDKTICGECGQPITGEVPGLDVTQRKPCPKCGSTRRTYGVELRASISSSVRADAIVITYPQKLLTLSRKLIDDGEFGIAIVVSHMACEIATERALSEAFAAKGIPYLEDPVTDLLSGYNLANPRIRKLYTALTGDDLANAPFWQAFKASAERRNKIVHSSVAVTKADAEESHLVTNALVVHLKK
jgi:hypothetical protein